MTKLKTTLRWSFLLCRALLRFLFIDAFADNYLKKDFKPQFGVPDQFGVPGLLLPAALLLVLFWSPLWIPVMVWIETEDYRDRFLKWLEVE